MIRLALVALAAVAAVQDRAQAGSLREVLARDGETVTVRLAVAEATKNVLTAVTFPDEIKNVVSAWDAKDLSVEHDGAKFFLKLLSKVEGYLDVTTVRSLHLRLYLVPAAGEVDSHLVIRQADPAAARPVSSGALELVKAMRLGEVPPEVSVRRGGGTILFENARLTVSLLWVYDAARFQGVVAAVSNRSDKESLHVDASQFQSADLVVAASKETVLLPGKSTRVYLVFARR